jgi:alpha-galactosidase
LHRSHLINAGVGISGMTVPEERSEMSLWAMESAPMIAGTDIVNMAGQSRKIYENTGVIAVDQDALGTQAAVLSSANGQWILEKPLQNGDKAVALFNAGSTAWKRVSVSMASLGLSSTKNYRATDLWSGDQSVFKNNLTVRSIAPHATVILRIKA